MGYFSENQIELQDKYSDQSYHGFEDQLLWRYEDLKDRYMKLLDMDAPLSGEQKEKKKQYALMLTYLANKYARHMAKVLTDTEV